MRGSRISGELGLARGLKYIATKLEYLGGNDIITHSVKILAMIAMNTLLDIFVITHPS